MNQPSQYRVQPDGDEWLLLFGCGDKFVAKLTCHPWDADMIAKLMNVALSSTRHEHERIGETMTTLRLLGRTE